MKDILSVEAKARQVTGLLDRRLCTASKEYLDTSSRLRTGLNFFRGGGQFIGSGPPGPACSTCRPLVETSANSHQRAVPSVFREPSHPDL